MRRHERRMLLPVAPDRSYAIAWTNREQDPAADEPLPRLVVTGIS